MSKKEEKKKEEKKKEKPEVKVSDEVKEPEVQLTETEKLQKDLAEEKDKYVRLFAEFDNMRKRNVRERFELIKYAHEEVVIEMLGFFEDFERCVQSARQEENAESNVLLKGVEMTFKRMQELLGKYDVKAVEAVGKPFDHTAHEAMMTAETDEFEDGMVMEVFQQGYKMGDRVVRTAKVKVAKNAVVPVEELVEEQVEKQVEEQVEEDKA